MKKSFNYVATSVMLLSCLMLQACPPAQTTSPVASSSPVGMESLKPVESSSPSASPSSSPVAEASAMPSSMPSIQASTMPSVMPTSTPVATSSPAFEGKTYKYNFMLKSGSATAFLTTLSPSKGRLLINFDGIDAVPSKVALLDSYGNELALTNSFNVAKNGNVNFDYLLKDGQEMTDIVVYVNGIAYKVSVKNGVIYSQVIPTPIPPNPTPTPMPDAPLKQTYDPCFNLEGFSVRNFKPCFMPGA
jgi:hypothetical protein